MRSIAVIGGGAAGLMAAITAARDSREVQIIEAGERVGQPILATGNGRCNLTNMQIAPEDYNAPAFVAPTLERYTPERIRSVFAQLGLLTHEEAEGRVYPLSNSANTVLDVLRLACRQQGVQVTTGFEAVDIERHADGYTVLSQRGALARADAVIVTTGGGTKLLGAAGHEMAPFTPVLCALKTETDHFRGLSGVRVEARVSLFDPLQPETPFATEDGEVLFRDYGLSGIVIFDMSRFAEPGQTISLDLLPAMDYSDLVARLKLRYESLTTTGIEYRPSYADLITGMFHPRVAACVLRVANCRPSETASPERIEIIARVAKGLRTHVKGRCGSKQAQVMRGGACAEGFDPQTLQSRLQPLLFAAGETLNVDGRCGGFNLHWAWSSGIVAGYNAARL